MAKAQETLQTPEPQAEGCTETGGAATASETAPGKRASTEGRTALTRGTDGETAETVSTETTLATGHTAAENEATEPATGQKTAAAASAAEPAIGRPSGTDRATVVAVETTTTPDATKERKIPTAAKTEVIVGLQPAATVGRELGLALNPDTINRLGRRIIALARLSRPENLTAPSNIHQPLKITTSLRL